MLRLAVFIMLVFLGGCLNNHANLAETSDGISSFYSQKRTPTPTQKKVGEMAYEMWKISEKPIRNRLANSLVLGNTLIGKNAKEVVEKLGEPDSPFSVPFRPGVTHFGYDLISGESNCEFKIITDEKGIIVGNYVEANY